MYKAKLWDEDKWNIHSDSYGSSKYENIFSDDRKSDTKYHEQKYGAKEKDVSSDYIRKDEQEEEENKTKNPFDDSEEEEKKKKELKEEEIPFKAAEQVFSEEQRETKKTDKRKNINTIEDAIKNAIEEEKNVIIMDS